MTFYAGGFLLSLSGRSLTLVQAQEICVNVQGGGTGLSQLSQLFLWTLTL